MSKLRFHLSVSADGYSAGPDPSEEEPLGVGGEDLHDWAFPLAAWREAHGREGGEVNASTQVVEETTAIVGAGLMGRNMFGPVHGGDWGDGSWQGWWGDNPPFHYPVFVLTHHEREPLEMEGGTTFTFVTDGIESALEQATAVAGPNGTVGIAGGASTVRQYLAAGSLDELRLQIVPIVVGAGDRFTDGLGRFDLEPVAVRQHRLATHITYRRSGR
jgi:dihydrofolate reductase